MHLYPRLYPHLFLILLSLVTAISKTDLQARQVKIVTNVATESPDQPRIEFLNQDEKASVSNPKVLQFPYLPECAFPSPEHVLEVLRFIKDSTVNEILVIGNGRTEDGRPRKVEQILKVYQAVMLSNSAASLLNPIQMNKVFEHSSDMDTTLKQFSKLIEYLVNRGMFNKEELAKVISILIHGQDQECSRSENLAFKALGYALSTEQSNLRARPVKISTYVSAESQDPPRVEFLNESQQETASEIPFYLRDNDRIRHHDRHVPVKFRNDDNMMLPWRQKLGIYYGDPNEPFRPLRTFPPPKIQRRYSYP